MTLIIIRGYRSIQTRNPLTFCLRYCVILAPFLLKPTPFSFHSNLLFQAPSSRNLSSVMVSVYLLQIYFPLLLVLFVILFLVRFYSSFFLFLFFPSSSLLLLFNSFFVLSLFFILLLYCSVLLYFYFHF
jgi:hypothetical protein